MFSTLTKAMVSGLTAGTAMAAVLTLAAKVEGHRPVGPLNATSHWYHGDEAGRSRTLDARHTLLGLATHYGASVFWGSIFEAVRRIRPGRSSLADAIGVSALAAFVDYVVVPRRLTPGWEKVVSPVSIAAAYGAMVIALWTTSCRSQRPVA